MACGESHLAAAGLGVAMGRRRSTGLWAAAAVCWTLLAGLSAGAVALLFNPAKPAVTMAVDLVRTPAPQGPNWTLRPLPASANALFVQGSKGPRADADADVPAERIELASMPLPQPDAHFTVSPLKSRTLKGLSDPARRAAEKMCLAEVVYFEARGQPVEAQIAVGQTVINRALSGAYPATLCGVAHQTAARDGACQYSFACDGLSSVSKDKADWELARELADRLLNGEVWLPEIGDATHSHPLAEHPGWTKYLQRVKRIGAIVFYRGDFAMAGNAQNADKTAAD